MALWTQAVQLRWRPELRFFEERTQLLRELEDLDLLKAFLWSDQEVGARLGPYEVVNVASGGLDITLTSPQTGPERLRQALRVVLRRVNARDITVGLVQFQYLLPLAVDGRVAQRTSAGALVPELAPEGEGVDWAILLDGRSVRLDTGFQVEYGVVRNDEMAARLLRSVGHGRGVGPPLSSTDIDGLPDAAVFFDWLWDIRELVGSGDVSEAVIRIWNAAQDESQQFTDRIVGQLGLPTGGGESGDMGVQG